MLHLDPVLGIYLGYCTPVYGALSLVVALTIVFMYARYGKSQVGPANQNEDTNLQQWSRHQKRQRQLNMSIAISCICTLCFQVGKFLSKQSIFLATGLHGHK